MANIKQIKLGNGTYEIRPLGLCKTGSTTTTKTVECSEFSLYEGATILIKFNYANTAAIPLLNINGTGAYQIRWNNLPLPATQYWAAGSIVEFVFDGSYYHVLGSIKDNNTTYTAASLGLSNVFKYCGTTTTRLTDGANNTSVTINGSSHTAENGCVVSYNNSLFAYNGSTWEEIGNPGSYKTIQTAVSNPTASGESVTFIDSISQNTNGVITVTKKTVGKVAEAECADTLNADDQGNSNLPVYFEGGVPVECSSELNVDITGNAKTSTVTTYIGVDETTSTNEESVMLAPSKNSSTKPDASSHLTFVPSSKTLKIGSAATGTLKIGGCTLVGYYNSSTTSTSNYIQITAPGGVKCSNGFYETSDEKLKEFKGTIPVDFNKLKQIPKQYFIWNSDKEQRLHIGTSAQEIQKIYPELVSENEDGTLSVNYSKLSVIALQAVDALNDKCNELEARLAKLEALLTKE